MLMVFFYPEHRCHHHPLQPHPLPNLDELILQQEMQMDAPPHLRHSAPPSPAPHFQARLGRCAAKSTAKAGPDATALAA